MFTRKTYKELLHAAYGDQQLYRLTIRYLEIFAASGLKVLA